MTGRTERVGKSRTGGPSLLHWLAYRAYVNDVHLPLLHGATRFPWTGRAWRWAAQADGQDQADTPAIAAIPILGATHLTTNTLPAKMTPHLTLQPISHETYTTTPSTLPATTHLLRVPTGYTPTPHHLPSQLPPCHLPYPASYHHLQRRDCTAPLWPFYHHTHIFAMHAHTLFLLKTWQEHAGRGRRATSSLLIIPPPTYYIAFFLYLLP